MTESDGDCLLDLVYGTLPVAEGPRAECDARDSVSLGRTAWVSAEAAEVPIHTIIKADGIPRHGEM